MNLRKLKSNTRLHTVSSSLKPGSIDTAEVQMEQFFPFMKVNHRYYEKEMEHDKQQALFIKQGEALIL